jgi:hypothetical protein
MTGESLNGGLIHPRIISSRWRRDATAGRGCETPVLNWEHFGLAAPVRRPHRAPRDCASWRLSDALRRDSVT